MDLAAAHDVVTGPFLMTDQGNGPPHFTALSPAVSPTQISKSWRYFFFFEDLFLVSGVTVTELMGFPKLAWRRKGGVGGGGCGGHASRARGRGRGRAGRLGGKPGTRLLLLALAKSTAFAVGDLGQELRARERGVVRCGGDRVRSSHLLADVPGGRRWRSCPPTFADCSASPSSSAAVAAAVAAVAAAAAASRSPRSSRGNRIPSRSGDRMWHRRPALHTCLKGTA